MEKIILISSYFLMLLVTGLSQNLDIGEPCETKRYNGTCVLIKKCPEAMKLVKLNDHKTLNIISCGFDVKDPKVCCRVAGDIITFNNKTEETATSRPRKTTTPKLEDTTTTITETYSDPFPDRKVCGQSKASDRIVGGTIAEIDDFPWLGRIRYTNDKGAFTFACAGALITDRYLLTAAHCVLSGRSYKPVSVRLGEWDEETEKDCKDGYCVDAPPVDVNISKIIIHPSYRKEIATQHDIALIQLEKPVNFTSLIQPVCLPTTEYIRMQDYLQNSAYWVAGWGLTEFGTTSPIKRKVKLDAVSTETCKGILNTIPEQSFPNIICAGGRMGKDSCRGDSGSPLVREVMEENQINWYLFGVTSLGADRCGLEGVPGVYTRVIRYMDWIREVVST